jgi:hypothetical protein
MATEYDVLHDVSAEEYGKMAGITASALKAGRTSMAHMHHEMQRARGEDGSPSMRLGTLAHMAVLEPHKWAEVVTYEGTRRGKEWDAFATRNVGREIVTATEHATVSAMRAAFMADRTASALLTACIYRETAIRWDGGDGIGACKARIDAYGKSCLLDYKTTRLLGQDGQAFMRSAETLGYLYQMAWYWRALGRRVSVFVIAQENVGPFCVGVYEIQQPMLVSVLFECESIARRYRLAERAGIYRGPLSDIRQWERPAWAVGEVDMSNGTMEGSEL